MAYSADVVRRARRVLESQKADHDSRQQALLREVYETLPRIREIDMQLRSSMVEAAQAAFLGGANTMDQVKKNNQALQAERKALILANFPAEYAEEKPLCEKCGGSGYIGTAMCSCLAEICRQEQKKELSLLACGEHRFADFHLDYYPETVDPQYGVSPRVVMGRILSICQKYAGDFTPTSGNLLFNGSTGLGKTMLSACIATVVAEKGYSVAYETAAHLFGKLEKDHFRPDEESAEAVKKLHTCDLLIMDDLGTELPGNFTVAALYTLLNDRLLAGKPMIISTNLNIDEIRARYSPQIASRLEGSFQLLPFVGNDIRVLKNK